jgi:uncharacterized protein (DUF427 family)
VTKQLYSRAKPNGDFVMTDITIKPATGTWVIRAGGAVLAETTAALELVEEDRAPVIYFPRADVAMAFLSSTDTKTTCPFKGDAGYFAIHTKSVVIDDAAWTYDAPVDEMAQIAGYLAFDTEKVAVEQL